MIQIPNRPNPKHMVVLCQTKKRTYIQSNNSKYDIGQKSLLRLRNQDKRLSGASLLHSYIVSLLLETSHGLPAWSWSH